VRLLKLETILVATDLTTTSHGAIVTASRLADAAGATLHVAHVAPREDELSAAAGHRAEYDRQLEKAVDPAGKTRPQRHLIFGEPHRAISALAGKIKADEAWLQLKDVETNESVTAHAGSVAWNAYRKRYVMVFNVLACNRDDHARNFAFLMEPDGTWRHTPAYDLTFSAGPA